MAQSEFYFLVTDARKMDYRIDILENGYMLVYEGDNPLLRKQYPEQFFSYQDGMEEWFEDRMHDLDIYARNLKLAKKVGEIIDGKLPAYAWPGGCPIYYYTNDGSMLCAECAEDDPLIVDGDVYYEGPAIECDGGCGKMLESAYGDPEEGEDDE